MKIFGGLVCLVVVLFLLGDLNGLHFKETNAIPGDIKKVRSQNIADYGRVVLFEEEDHSTFGIAELEKKFGFLYQFDGSTGGYVEEGKPFNAIGLADDEEFLVAVKTAENSAITFIALGNHMEEITPMDPYELSLADVKENSNDYHLKEVRDNYVLFVLDEYNKDTWTVRAFDENGNLIADELSGGDARYIDWK